MNKDKLKNLTKYLEDTKSKLSSDVPPKHKLRAAQYKAFLNKEVELTTKKLEDLKLQGNGKI